MKNQTSRQDAMQKYALFILSTQVVSISIPLIMLNTPLLLISAISLVMFLPYILKNQTGILLMLFFYNIAKPLIYVFAIIFTIKGKQDAVAMVFYIIAAVQVPRMFKNLILTIYNFFSFIKN